MNKIILSFGTIAFVLILLLISSSFLFCGDNVPINNESCIDFNDGWQYNDTIVNLPYTLSSDEQTVLISKKLPDSFVQGMTIGTRTSGQYVKVFIDGEEIYSFGFNQNRPYGKSPGRAWHLIRMPLDAQGKTISLMIHNVYENSESQIYDMCFGSKNANVFRIFEDNFLGFAMCLLISWFGFIFFLMYIAFRREYVLSKLLIYVSLFCFQISFWSLAETKTLQLFFGNQYFVYIFGLLTLMSIPIPLLGFFSSICTQKIKKYYDALILILIINITVCAVLQIFNVVDLMNSLFTTHLIIVLGILLIAATVADKRNLENPSNQKFLLFFTVFMSIFASVDLIRFYALTASTDGATFTRTGFLIYLIILSVTISKKAFEGITHTLEANALKRLAYVDMLTKIGNRAAYERDIEKIQTTGQRAAVVMIDLNRFKDINDNYGHKTGDRVLIETAKFIQNSFGRHKCYRMGGDEFTVIVGDASSQEIETCIDLTRQAMKKFNDENEYILSAAFGFAYFDPNIDSDLNDSLTRADKKMYEQKNSE